jgi:hypothetical protein
LVSESIPAPVENPVEAPKTALEIIEESTLEKSRDDLEDPKQSEIELPTKDFDKNEIGIPYPADDEGEILIPDLTDAEVGERVIQGKILQENSDGETAFLILAASALLAIIFERQKNRKLKHNLN